MTGLKTHTHILYTCTFMKCTKIKIVPTLRFHKGTHKDDLTSLYCIWWCAHAVCVRAVHVWDDIVPKLPGHIIQGCFSCLARAIFLCLCRAFLFSFPKEKPANLSKPDRLYQGSHLRRWHQIHDFFSCWEKKKKERKKFCQRLSPMLAPQVSGLWRESGGEL